MRVCSVGYVTREWEVFPDGRVVETIAGPPYFFSIALSSLGCGVVVVTRVSTGDDALLEDLRSNGVDVVNLGSRSTMTSRIIYGGSLDDRRIVVTSRADPFEEEDLMHCGGCEAIHLGPLTTRDISLGVIEEASESSRVVLDLQGYTREVVGGGVRYVAWTDYPRVSGVIWVLKLDDREGGLLTGESRPERVVEKLVSTGANEVLLTTSRGVYARAPGEGLYFAPYRVGGVVGRMGRGDTATAAYTYCRLRGEGLDYSTAFVAAATSLKLMTRGPLKADEKRVVEYMEEAGIKATCLT